MLENIYNQKITILNKLKQTDSTTGADVWYKHTVENATWYLSSERTVSNSSVLIGTYIKVLIPFNDMFMPYETWKLTGNQDLHYTISSGDYIVLGNVVEDITNNNIVKVMTSYEPNVCQVKHFQIKNNRFGATVQIYIEGV